MPTRSEIEAWSTTHLEAAANHWRSTATRWEGHFETIHSGMLRPGGTTWEGPAADAAAERSWVDLVKVRGGGDALYAAAEVAKNGADDIAWAKRLVVDAINEAEEADFTVGQDFSVTDKSSWGGLLRTTVARQQEAKAFAAEIGTRVQALVALDQQAAAQITSALVPLETMQFDETPDKHEPATQAVDFRHLKRSPEPAPPPAPPLGPNSSDIRSVLDQLPRGTRPGIREVRSPEDLQKLAKWMTQDGTEGTNRYGDPAKGAWKDLPDGSKVGERAAANSTGEPALDVDLQGPNGTEHWKVHINRESGAEPNIPAPKAPPVEAQSPQSSPAERGGQAGPAEHGGQRAPVESAPAAKPAPAVEPAPAVKSGPGIEGWGGPSAEPFGPQPVHPPGSIHHPFPILGEDDPAENPRDFEGH